MLFDHMTLEDRTGAETTLAAGDAIVHVGSTNYLKFDRKDAEIFWRLGDDKLGIFLLLSVWSEDALLKEMEDLAEANGLKCQRQKVEQDTRFNFETP